MELVENPFVSDFTKRTLEQFGWKTGDAIPAELGAALLRYKEAAPRSARTDVLVDAAVLSPEIIEEVKGMLATAKKVAANRARAEEVDQVTQEMNPDVAALYKSLEAASPGPEIVDDRAEETPPAPAAAPAASPSPPPQPVDPANIPVTSAPMVILPFCPRCGWDMRQKFEVAVTDTDKQDFLVATLGSQRFQRRFDIFGGKMVLVFRTLLAEENRLIMRQLVLDQQTQDIATEDEWFLRLMEYRLACSLESVFNGEGKPLHVIPTLAEYPHTPPPEQPLQTALVGLRTHVNDKVLAQEVTRRLAGQHLRQFQRLVEALEAMALEPSFWEGIG